MPVAKMSWAVLQEVKFRRRGTCHRDRRYLRRSIRTVWSRLSESPLFDSETVWNVGLISKKQPNSSSVVASMPEAIGVSCPKWPNPQKFHPL